MLIEKHFDEESGTWLVLPVGYIDLFGAPELKAELETMEQGNVILSCEQLGYIDSAGIQVLREFSQKKRAGGNTVKIRRLKSYIYRLFVIAGIAGQFEIEDIEEVRQ